MTDAPELSIEQQAALEAMVRKAETGEQFAEVCRLEAEMIAAARVRCEQKYRDMARREVEAWTA